MIARIAKSLLALSLVTVMFSAGCNQPVTPPAPLSMDQLPPALEKAFSKAKADTKDLADQVLASLRSQDYPRAYMGLQTLAGKSGLNKEQSSVATRGMFTVNQLLQSAQAQGDAKAAETLKFIRQNK